MIPKSGSGTGSGTGSRSGTFTDRQREKDVQEEGGSLYKGSEVSAKQVISSVICTSINVAQLCAVLFPRVLKNWLILSVLPLLASKINPKRADICSQNETR